MENGRNNQTFKDTVASHSLNRKFEAYERKIENTTRYQQDFQRIGASGNAPFLKLANKKGNSVL